MSELSVLTVGIRLNGEDREIADDLTVEGLLLSLKLRPALVVVEHNGEILRRERYAEVRIHAGDSLELVHFVGGG
ncbi:MAG: sulfur carrier protein ThiS [Gemmatimonadota bacterium]|nr:sulfur carrier protein ThiS [Gemmatimonadota bacterium]